MTENKTKDNNASKGGQFTRIQLRNRERILDAALTEFSTKGFEGTTLDKLARHAGMTKPNLLYYYSSKEAIFIAALEKVMERWLEPMIAMDADGDPKQEILKYIKAKFEISLDRPEDSRLFANELLRGAPLFSAVLQGHLKELVDEKAKIISHWITQGKLVPIDPYHLIFMLWATTQHYADFEVQISAILGDDKSRKSIITNASDTLEMILLRGLFV